MEVSHSPITAQCIGSYARPATCSGWKVWSDLVTQCKQIASCQCAKPESSARPAREQAMGPCLATAANAQRSGCSAPPVGVRRTTHERSRSGHARGPGGSQGPGETVPGTADHRDGEHSTSGPRTEAADGPSGPCGRCRWLPVRAVAAAGGHRGWGRWLGGAGGVSDGVWRCWPGGGGRLRVRAVWELGGRGGSGPEAGVPVARGGSVLGRVDPRCRSAFGRWSAIGRVAFGRRGFRRPVGLRAGRSAAPAGLRAVVGHRPGRLRAAGLPVVTRPPAAAATGSVGFRRLSATGAAARSGGGAPRPSRRGRWRTKPRRP
jgi:hypothetical protein